MAKMSREDIEEVLENLVALIDNDEDVSPESLSKRSGIEQKELKAYVRALKEQGYLELERELTPTAKGYRMGRRMVRKHRLLERFLHDVLGLKKDAVHEEACRLEHGLSDDAEAALCRYLEHPQNCPDGERFIPACAQDVDSCEECGKGKGSEEHVMLLPLTGLEPGRTARIRFIRGGKKAVQRLKDMGLVPDVVIIVLKKAPFGGPVELEVCSTKLALGRGIAEKVFVEVC